MVERLVPNRILLYVMPSRYLLAPHPNLEIMTNAVDDDHRTGQEQQ